MTEQPLGKWECAYTVNVVAWPINSILFDYDPEAGWVNLPRLFNYSFVSGYRKVLVREVEDEGRSQLWYIADLQDPLESMLPTIPAESEDFEEDSSGEAED